MTRLLALAVGAALVASPVAAHAAKAPAKKPTTRTVTWDYQGPAGPNAGGSSVTFCTDTTCTSIPLEAHELKAAISVTDDAGQKVGLLTSVDGVNSLTCGAADVALTKNTQLDLKAVLNPDCPGVPTSGTVSVTITGLK